MSIQFTDYYQERKLVNIAYKFDSSFQDTHFYHAWVLPNILDT